MLGAALVNLHDSQGQPGRSNLRSGWEARRGGLCAAL